MIDKEKICILVPLYKLSLEPYEYASIKQLFDVLGNKYTISPLCSNYVKDNLNIYNYLFPFNEKHYCFHNRFFVDIHEYSKLMLNVELYKLLQKNGFEYVLIYQPDCWVFRDELEEWCNKGYDYIGAPFFVRSYDLYGIIDDKYKYKYNGNGGFSLRKIDAFINQLTRLSEEYGLNDFLSIIPNDYPEDLFITYLFDFEKYPTFLECSKFAWDGGPDFLYLINNFKLPFGCHRFHKYYKMFYKHNNLININVEI